jgi:outer membrane protein assembly factor BamB
MVVTREPGEVLVLRHTFGPEVACWVERVDPVSLEVLDRSPDLAAGPMWPGGMAIHPDDGALHVVFGNHAHRLVDLQPVASRELPRAKPYNSFVTLGDGSLATKDFAGTRPGFERVPPEEREPSELLVLDPVDLSTRASLVLPEPSVARLSAAGDDLYAVGDPSLLRVRWDGAALALTGSWTYRTIEGQTYGWDVVVTDTHAWFLDDGDGTERYAGSLRGASLSTAPLHLVRVDLAAGAVDLVEICGRPGGIVANPPIVDVERGIAVGFDSGNGVLAAFDAATLAPLWSRAQWHGSHMVLFAGSGELVTADHDAERMLEEVVVLDVTTGEELAREPTGSPLQSVVFPAAGFARDVYLCSFSTLTRISAV